MMIETSKRRTVIVFLLKVFSKPLIIRDFYLLYKITIVVHIKCDAISSVLTWKKIKKCHTTQLPVATTVPSVMFFVLSVEAKELKKCRSIVR